MEQDRQARDRLIIGRLIDALPDAVIVLGAADRVAALNAPARSLFPALRPDDLLARSLRAPDVLDAVKRVRSSGTPERVTWLQRVPVERFFELNAALMEGPQFEPAMILTLRDLSEARRVERMRVDFVANASHELRTPLASLLGFVETLQGPAREDKEARTRFLSIMREQAQRMARLVDDLLSLSRIEQNLHLRPRAPVDIVAILRHIADTLAPMAEENGLALELALAQNVVVPGDRDELARGVSTKKERTACACREEKPASSKARAASERENRSILPPWARGVIE